ncbi:heterokaryon incompatibility protein [Stipitochalara longipes BDJ]|nr:heterokaryon incompatibility protein [Stipitochalara longipes BDJ]
MLTPPGVLWSCFLHYEYSPLPDPKRAVRLFELLPANFDDDIRIRIHYATLTPPPRGGSWRESLEQLRKDLPKGWEAFQTLVDHKYFFRNMKTGKVQWEHPDSNYNPRKYQLPPKDGSFPPYETLSYVWGSSKKSAAVTVERPNDEGPARLCVTESLITALRYLRYPQKKRTLWIDAICLNQADNTELSQQVPRMGDIYRHAYTGTAWLGIEGNGSSEALSTLRYLGDQIVAEEDVGCRCRTSATPMVTRLWVVQEIHPGAVLQCGHDTLSLAPFADAQYAFYCKSQLPPGLRPTMTQVDGTLSRFWFWVMALPRLLYRAATFKQCEDPRDKIYGLLGLAPSQFVAGIHVSYEKSNMAVDTYTNAVLSHAKSSQRLEHFHNCFAGSSEKKIPNGPSWVPDWVSDVPGETYIPSQFVTVNSRARFRHPNTGHESGKPDILEVLGVRFGAISHATEALPPRLDAGEAIRCMRQWQPQDLDAATYGPTGEPLRKAYAITLICNGLKEREPDWIDSPVDEWAKQEWEEALFGEHATGTPSSLRIRQDVADALQCCGERLFFRTGDGYIGLAPADAQVGDIVTIVLGSPNAIIFRPNKRGNDHFSVVGECFVYGLHDAIPLLGPLPQPWRGIAAWVHGDRRGIRFLNTETREKTMEDPRLEPSPEWKRVDTKLDRDDPTLYDFFQHKETREIINYDPRTEPDKLEARGVKLTWFSLV